MKQNKTILIFGLSSFVGSNLADYFKSDNKVIGTYYQTKVQLPEVLAIPCDVLLKEDVFNVVDMVRPDVAIVAVGLNSVTACHEDSAKAHSLNSTSATIVAEVCAHQRVPLYYLSSSAVLGGEQKKYMEMDAPDPLTVLGKAQASAEIFIQKNCPNYLIFRSCPLYGHGICWERPNILERIQRHLSQKSPLHLDDEQRLGFLDVYYLAAIMKRSLDEGHSNRLFQVCSSDVMGEYQFARLYCEVFGEDPSGLIPSKIPFPQLQFQAAKRKAKKNQAPLSFQLDVTNLESFMGLKMPSVREGLELTFRRMSGQGARGPIKAPTGAQGGIQYI